MAHEAGFIEALIASERVAVWLDGVRQSDPAKQRSALADLEAWVVQRDAYAEEARQAGAVNVLTALLKRTDDEQLQASAARVIAACSGHAAEPSQERVFRYGAGLEVAVCEGGLGDGHGARVWLAAQALARTLVAAPELVRGQNVLELGAGCGVVGLLAAKMGAAKATLTDYEPAVLHCLQRSVKATAALTATNSAAAASGHDGPAAAAGMTETAVVNQGSCNGTTAAGVGVDESDPETFDPEDADSCDDLDDFLAGGARDTQQLGNVTVRRLDWGDAIISLAAPAAGNTSVLGQAHLPVLSAGQPKIRCDVEATASGITELPSKHSGPADLGPDAQFEVVLASDVVYDGDHVAGLAAALARHLAPAGRALLCCPIREQEVFDAFVEQLHHRRLTYELQAVAPLDCDIGVSSQARDYEGGFQLVAVQHEAASPAAWPWHAMLSWQARC